MKKEKVITIKELRKFISIIPDPSTMPYEHRISVQTALGYVVDILEVALKDSVSTPTEPTEGLEVIDKLVKFMESVMVINGENIKKGSKVWVKDLLYASGFYEGVEELKSKLSKEQK